MSIGEPPPADLTHDGIGPPTDSLVEAWIDDKLAEIASRTQNSGESKVREIVAEYLPAFIRQLVAWTLPEPGREVESPQIVDPFSGNLDKQCWFWNRAASRLGKQSGDHFASAEIWAAHYLCYISLQITSGLRFHKGMPLCNIGVALTRAGDTKASSLPWLLGIIEDYLTQPEAVHDNKNYQNLISTASFGPAVVERLISTLDGRFLAFSIIPSVPEIPLGVWLDPLASHPSEPDLLRIASLIEDLKANSPGLPPSDNRPWSNLLKPFWGPWQEKIARG